jgi:hypothetical protein
MKIILEKSCGAPTAQVVAAFESLFGIAFPADYRAFLEESNGGYPPRPGLVFGKPQRSVASFLPLLGEGPHEWKDVTIDSVLALQEGLEEESDDEESEASLTLLPIVTLSGGDLVCLDYSASPPTVVVWEHEQDEDGRHRKVPVAKSFTGFLKLLRKAPEVVVVDKTEPPLLEEDVLRGASIRVWYRGVDEEAQETVVEMNRADFPAAVWNFLAQYNGFDVVGELGFPAMGGRELLEYCASARLPWTNPRGYPELVHSRFRGAGDLDEKRFRFSGRTEGLPPMLLCPLLVCRSKKYVCIDFRKETYGQVVLLDYEASAPAAPSFEVLAPDFDAFLAMLEPGDSGTQGG